MEKVSSDSILDFEGKNIEEKESRHDLDKNLWKIEMQGILGQG